MSKKTKFLVALGAVFLVVGIPIIINECYKANCGYITVWDGSDVLGYYGTILGSVIAVISIIVTIAFTKKQIQRESFLKNEDEKWKRLREIFLQILNDINPMRVLKDVMDNGFTDPTKAIHLFAKVCNNRRLEFDSFALNKCHKAPPVVFLITIIVIIVVLVNLYSCDD